MCILNNGSTNFSQRYIDIHLGFYCLEIWSLPRAHHFVCNVKNSHLRNAVIQFNCNENCVK